jgi:hypothetical protein
MFGVIVCRDFEENRFLHDTGQHLPDYTESIPRTQQYNIRFEVFTAVTMKNGVFWDVTLCGSCNNRHFGGT